MVKKCQCKAISISEDKIVLVLRQNAPTSTISEIKKVT